MPSDAQAGRQGPDCDSELIEPDSAVPGIENGRDEDLYRRKASRQLLEGSAAADDLARMRHSQLRIEELGPSIRLRSENSDGQPGADGLYGHQAVLARRKRRSTA